MPTVAGTIKLKEMRIKSRPYCKWVIYFMGTKAFCLWLGISLCIPIYAMCQESRQAILKGLY